MTELPKCSANDTDNIVKTSEKSGTNRSKIMKSFDFSSKSGWDTFYKQDDTTPNGTHEAASSTLADDEDNPDENSSSFFYEWHASIPHSAITAVLPPVTTATLDSNNGETSVPTTSCLIVGCGNSKLPLDVHDYYTHQQQQLLSSPKNKKGNFRITCLDYSQPCLDIVEQEYKKHNFPQNDNDDNIMEFVCGDATILAQSLSSSPGTNNNPPKYDSILDKGLIDSLMCTGEGYDYFITKLFRGVSDVLDPNGGMYVLLSYKLSKSTMGLLTELGDEMDMKWDFDIEGLSNDRVSFSVGTRWEEENDVERES